MLGLVIALILSTVLLAMGKNGNVIFKKATGFLFKWYVVIASLVALITIVLAVLGFLTVGFLAGGPLGALIGTFAGGAVALIATVYIGVAYVLQICGSKILQDSLTVDSIGTAAWDMQKVAFGIIMLFLGVAGLPFLS